MSGVGAAELEAAAAVLERAVAARAFPGAVLAVGEAGHPAQVLARGHLSYAADAPRVAPDTIYDLASLTKVVATTAVAMALYQDGVMDLEEPVRRWLPEFRGELKDQVTARHLLSHSSGIAWWAPLFKELSGQEAFVRRICETPLESPAGARTVYSDMGFILLGAVLERVAGRPLGALAQQRVFDPLGMAETGYRPSQSLRPRVAPTEVCAWRGRLVHGEVHDENAYAMGGVAPHAGLFGTAPELARLARMLAEGGLWQGRRIFEPVTIERFTRRAGIPGSTRALGWDTPNPTGYSTAGSLMSRLAFGHIGFTGTSLWIDPTRGAFVILLSNRIHPTRDNEGIRAVRPAVADAVVEALDARR